MLELLRPERADDLEEYYKRLVRSEHMHDYHYPDPNGPPNPSQPCAVLMKGTSNMFYCKNGYPRDIILSPSFCMVKQDAMRPDLWRVHLERNCPTMNSHQPVATVGNQANTDKSGVLTRNQVDTYLTKYCTKPSGNYGCKNVLYDVYDDMLKRDARIDDDKEEEGKAKLGPKMHKAFMAEAGAEMCQAEVAHYANGCPEYLCSRPVKDVHFYKQALAVIEPSTRRKSKWNGAGEEEEACFEDGGEPCTKRGAKLSDLELYEKRVWWSFAPDTPLCPDLPAADTSEEQVAAASAFDFYRLVRYHGGKVPWLEWHAPLERPIVLISPTLRLNIEGDFPTRVRWALLQYHPWTDRNQFLNEANLNDEAVVAFFDEWISSPRCPWYIAEQYQHDNKKQLRAPARKACATAPEPTATEEADAGEGDAQEDPYDGYQQRTGGHELLDQIPEIFVRACSRDQVFLIQASPCCFVISTARYPFQCPPC